MKICIVNNIQHIIPLSCSSRTLCGMILEPGTLIFNYSGNALDINCENCKKEIVSVVGKRK